MTTSPALRGKTEWVLTAASVHVYMGWWPVCARPNRPAGVPQWRRRRHWAAADRSGGLGTGTSGWPGPTCTHTKQAHTLDHHAEGLRDPQKNEVIFWVGQYLILSVTPCGTPMLTVADRTLCRLIFLSAPYSTTVPNQPVLEGQGHRREERLLERQSSTWAEHNNVQKIQETVQLDSNCVYFSTS